MKKDREKPIIAGYDFTTPEARLVNVPTLFEKAKAARSSQEREWEKDNDYYNFCHDVTAELKDFCSDRGRPWTPASCPDPWIMVESQIDPVIPTPEFRGRDTDMDSAKAKKREFAVKYIIEANDLQHQNTANERRLLKLGDAFWCAYWDADRRCGIYEGDIAVKAISPEAIFPDPSVKTGDIQDGQYVAFVYTMHKVEFWQKYKKRLGALNKGADEVDSSSYVPITSVFDLTTAIDDTEDTVQVLEFWFKWPDDAEITTPEGKKLSVRAGDVACSVQAGDIELKLIPRYWKRTYRQNSLFPFVHYWRIRDENSFWNKSELYAIRDLVDAEDRKLGMALINDAFLANDIVLVEEDALSDGQMLTNAPGEVISVRHGKIGGVARLGGLSSAGNATVLLNYLKEQIERTNRNYETNLGKETSRQTTASGLAMLREDASEQDDIKKSDRRAGFERLYQLLDMMALEWFDDQRLLFLGANEEEKREAEGFNFLADEYGEIMPEVRDALTGEVVREEWLYWPKVDVTVAAGDGVIKGKQATLSALQTLAGANITADNYKFYEAMLDILDLPQKEEIKELWEMKFAMPAPVEVPQVMQEVPQMMPEAPVMQAPPVGY